MTIEEIYVNKLYSIKYSNNSTNEFHRIYDESTDLEYISTFVDNYYDDLQEKDKKEFTKEDLIMFIFQEVRDTYEFIEEIGNIRHKNFERYFVPYDSRQSYSRPYPKLKWRERFLRIYSIGLKDSCFLVSGGTLKFTRANQDKEHTKIEMQKFNWCITYLKENSITDIDSLTYYFNPTND